MSDDAWMCRALEAIDGAGLGDDPLSELSDREINQLDRVGLIRLIRPAERVDELGNYEKLNSFYLEVELTRQGENYFAEKR